MTSEPAGLDTDSRSTGSDRFRPEIEGMRAIAVALVLAYHAGISLFSGGYVGVDVFFVISGFLITGLLIRDFESNGKVRLSRFYARRIRRLLPAAATTLAGVAVISIAALPATRWRAVAGDITWSSLYGINWRLAGRAVDYLASGDAVSPVQHFWSLAVEEQFYLVWPATIIAAIWLARRRGIDPRVSLLVAVTTIGVISLLRSVVETSSTPERAFFVSDTRVWELSVGAILAIVYPWVRRLRPRPATLLSWAGIAAIGLAAVSFDETTLFPGWTALLPVLGAAALIAGITTFPDSAPGRMLGVGSMRRIGGLSYSLYLWHWPFLVGATAWWGELSQAAGLAVVAVSVIPAWLTHRFVENPIRRSQNVVHPPVRGFALASACMAMGLVAAAVVSLSVPATRSGAALETTSGPASISDSATTRAAVGSTPDATVPGITTAVEPSVAPSTAVPEPTLPPLESLVPHPLEAAHDLPLIYDSETECHRAQAAREPTGPPCLFGNMDADLLVTLVGDSHAAQWFPTLDVLAERIGFRLQVLTKTNCPLATTTVLIGEPRRAYEECHEWNDNLLSRLIESDRPNLVVTSSAFWYPVLEDGEAIEFDRAQEILGRGLAGRWQQLLDAGIPVLVIQDPPAPFISQLRVAECLVGRSSSVAECSFDRSEAMAFNTSHLVAAALSGVPLVPTADWVCGPESCPPTIDGFVVWRDLHHLTASFAANLASELGPYVAEALDVAWPG